MPLPLRSEEYPGRPFLILSNSVATSIKSSKKRHQKRFLRDEDETSIELDKEFEAIES